MMNKLPLLSLIFLTLIFILSLSACNSADGQSTDGDLDLENETTEKTEFDLDVQENQETENSDFDFLYEKDISDESDLDLELWEFDRDNYDIVNGWILLDSNPDAVKDAINKASLYGVNHIQLSHGLIMNIDDLLGDTPKADINTLNAAISQAHQKNMKAYIWVHELPLKMMNICYDPADPVWEERVQDYRDGLALLPDLDGVILMFGSAGASPWYTLCSCDWCSDNYDGSLFEVPPSDEKIRIVTEKIGGAIVSELGKELFIRTFVHEPSELDWHSNGLAAVDNLEFSGMHKGPVQDWQPYNPHHQCMGNIGNHPSVMELDMAGEYYGQAILPFCSPGYYRYRFNHMWKNKGVGAVLRVERGSNHAIGTVNEINLFAASEFLKNPLKPLDEIWDEFIESFFGLSANAEGQETLKQILADTFYIRINSHYILGIWALEKGSNIPSGLKLDQFKDRGEMPKWDTDWQEIWDALDKPDEDVVKWIWQEGTEAVLRSEKSLANIQTLSEILESSQYEDMLHRMKHQYYSSRVWRAVKLFIWSKRALDLSLDLTATDAELKSWMAWSHLELLDIKENMIANGLENVTLASLADIQKFVDNTKQYLTAKDVIAESPPHAFSELRIEELGNTNTVLSFVPTKSGNIFVDYGLEIPQYGNEIALGECVAGEKKTFTITNIEANSRLGVRLRTADNHKSGHFWVFTK